MNLKSIIVLPLILAGLTGCNSTTEQIKASIVTVPFSAPLQTNFRNEISVARYSELLLATDLPTEQRAQLYYNRGRLYDGLGLSTLARIDFNRAIKMKPDLAEAYNFLGIHHTLLQEYGKAYEMFEAVLELDERHEYAYLNRGIALYYDNRIDLANDDFSAFLERSPQDAYRVMWLYLAQLKHDPIIAKANLKANQQAINDAEWSSQLVKLYLGELSEEQFLQQISVGVKNQQEYSERLCEAYFYLAKLYQFQGNEHIAADFFKLALSTNVSEFIEYKYARLELDIWASENAS
ncbi:lipoprotein NlpI [Pseudoalteromonas sp. MMG013]|uniref:lipoprotein NlpI n=1 Tax=unclassified Pseudoalteromonas TaxID=194690 RepID=UPI001B37F455|nr:MULTISPECIES: lipoprotein NlpI [unclassified Pseudoalteromonas]MBQ4851828.1 lipoprotein NlpI [Pseudoalteromonas sp. MMG012]MBQ4864334.1 lipoprotein NlpI [Pseudoalteromonas sp. MMG013]